MRAAFCVDFSRTLLSAITQRSNFNLKYLYVDMYVCIYTYAIYSFMHRWALLTLI